MVTGPQPTPARLGASRFTPLATLLVVGVVAVGGFVWYQRGHNEAAEATRSEGRIGPEAAPRVLPGERVDPTAPAADGDSDRAPAASDARP